MLVYFFYNRSTSLEHNNRYCSPRAAKIILFMNATSFK